MSVSIGGQALVEGVLMRSANYVAVAVRDPQKKIKTKIYRAVHPGVKYKRWFIIRGFLSLVDMLIIGMRELLWSSEVASGEKVSGKESSFAVLLSVLFAVGLFVVVPFYVSKVFVSEYWLFHVVEGLLRVGLFVGYVWLISFSKDVRRTFQYHGAEHASIACWEAKKSLTVAHVKKFSTLHPRCGTAFIFIVFILAIIVFSLITVDTLWLRLVLRLLLLPIIAGLSYEILKINAKYHLPVLEWLTVPGLWLQKITTKRFSDDQAEVAIIALKNVLVKEKIR
ncbi:MAG TPA: DUF1385 domain-containing protein [Candidatus Nanoarchaeia archaeon]|nr:DUF1385 domain-containing protein [Candidatus Nanoarchaeia archaeon]